MTQDRPAQRLREILDQPGILVLPGVYDCLSARLAARAGFPALFTSGFGFAASLLGMPDMGLLAAPEVIAHLRNICRAVSVPVVADLDTGYGGTLNVYRTVQEAVAAGAAGIILEDQTWPKRCGHFSGKSVVPLEEHVAKLRVAVEARGDSGLVVIARTDSRAVYGLDEAVRRGRAYFEAGADVVFIEAPEAREELEEIPRALPDVPLFVNMIEHGRTPLLPAAELERMGFKIVVYPLSGLFAAAAAMDRVYRHLLEHGTTEGGPELCEFSEFAEVMEAGDWDRIDRRFSEA
ncbi:MAG: methylisocitrate lyase [Acidobacteriota bacterium]